MRVHVDDKDGGAVAVIVALLTVVLIGLAAFTTDFGLAYVAKRQLQTGSDAASLGAAGQYAITPGTCAALAANASLKTSTGATGDAIRESNRVETSRLEYTVTCDPDGNLLVTYSASDTSPRILGSVFGANDYAVDRTATASVEVAEGGVGLRPYAVCNEDLPPRAADGSYSAPPGVFTLSFTNSNCQKPSGNWWTIQCPEVTADGQNNSNAVLADKTRNGCTDPIRIVPNQPDADPQLSQTLIAACAAGYGPSCLKGDPGNNFGSSGVKAAWASLVGKTITLPVFYDQTIIDPNGTNSGYPVYRLAAVRVCGYHWGSNAYGPSGVTASGPCAGANAQPGGNQQNYLLVNWVYVLLTGDSTPSTCNGGLGSGCDTGVRTIRLVN